MSPLTLAGPCAESGAPWGLHTARLPRRTVQSQERRHKTSPLGQAAHVEARAGCRARARAPRPGG
eukprot:8317547-Prorocentrum_lima.AAC.1